MPNEETGNPATEGQGSIYLSAAQAVQNFQNIVPRPPTSPPTEAQKALQQEFQDLWHRWLELHKDEILHLVQGIDAVRSTNIDPENFESLDPETQLQEYEETRIHLAVRMHAVKVLKELSAGLQGRLLYPLNDLQENDPDFGNFAERGKILAETEKMTRACIDALDRPILEGLKEKNKPAKIQTRDIPGLTGQISMTTSISEACVIEDETLIPREFCEPKKSLVNKAWKNDKDLPGTRPHPIFRITTNQSTDPEPTGS